MSAETLTVAGSAQPLDLLLYRRYRREIPGFVEATYAANPGLADLGPLLPIGTKVTVTVPVPAPVVTARNLVRLFQ